MLRVPSALLAVLLISAGAKSAFADTFFDFTFTGSTFSGAGVFDTVLKHPGTYQVVDVTGTTDTGNGPVRTISGLIAAGGYESNDNLLFFPSGIVGAPFDGSGVSFALNNGAEVNLFSGGAYLMRAGGREVFETATYSVTPASSPVPEPGSLALLSTGALGVIGAVRRRLVRG